MSEYSRARDFIENHWGDLLSLYILHLGLFIIWKSHGDTDIMHVGESFILTAVATLRFKGQPKPTGTP